MEKLLIFFKFMSVALSLGSGILGTITSFKKKVQTNDGEKERITVWGWTAVGGLVLAAIVGVAAHVTESYLQQQGAREAAEAALEATRKIEMIISNINRSLHPLELRSVHLSMVAPVPHKILPDFANRFNEEIQFYSENYVERFGENTIASWRGIDTNNTGQPLFATITPSSRAYPQEQTFEYLLLRHDTIWLRIYKVGLDTPDVSIKCSSDDVLRLYYDFGRKQLSLAGTLTPQEPAEWQRTGRVVSLLDLPGAKLTMELDRLLQYTSDDPVSLYGEFSDVKLDLDFGPRQMRVEPHMWTKTIDSRGAPAWEYSIPDDFAQMKAVEGTNSEKSK